MVEEFFINQSNRLLLKTHTCRGGKFCGDLENKMRVRYYKLSRITTFYVNLRLKHANNYKSTL